MNASGISVVIPVHNGRRLLPRVIAAIQAECQPYPFEILAVDDGSTDGSIRYLRGLAEAGAVRVVDGPGRGVAAAVNAGIREATFPLICQIDQDVVVNPGWLATLLAALDEPEVAAAQGRYAVAADAGVWARVMGRDLDGRYATIRRRYVDHVCTGNTVYRASALNAVGLLDERFGYAADNDVSYRLVTAGFKLAFVPGATSVHHWRDSCAGYLRQQFGVGYGRLDLVARHPNRVTGDDVSGVGMILHAAVMTLSVALLIVGVIALLLGSAWQPFVFAAAAAVGLLALERSIVGVRAWRHSDDLACLAFPAAHLLRDVAWSAAIAGWAARRVAGSLQAPQHSMPRAPWRGRAHAATDRAWLCTASTLVVIPAFNERASLGRVVRDIRRVAPGIDVLVVNDGSTDETAALLPHLGVRWLTLPERLGVGSAVRAGVRYAHRLGYDYVIRIDGDAQHRACDIGRLVVPVLSGRADAVCGSRYARRRRLSGRHATKVGLAVCLSALTGRRITDPTSGLWAFGPRAIALLSRHHPTGYPEPELLLLLRRHSIRFEEVAIRMRPRTAGKTTLTWWRKAVAFARTVLAVMIVPLRRIEPDTGSDR
jgi:glycosyltransferase involved in cell wall biosynthesis